MTPPTQPITPAGALWRLATIALIAAAFAVIGARLGAAPVDVDPPRDALAADVGTALGLLAHNLPVALWPLALVALGWPRLPGLAPLGGVLVLGHIIGHATLLATALAQQPALWRYLPHLPLEAVAIALPAATWISARHTRAMPAQRVLVRQAALVAVLLALAAMLETFAVPL